MEGCSTEQAETDVHKATATRDARVAKAAHASAATLRRRAVDAVLAEATRSELSCWSNDLMLRQEMAAKQRVTMGRKIANSPSRKTLNDFEFKLQPSVDQRLFASLATGRFLAQADDVLIFGAPVVGKTHFAIVLGRAAVEGGHSVLFTSATALLAALTKADSEGQQKPASVLQQAGAAHHRRGRVSAVRAAQWASLLRSWRAVTSAAASSSPPIR